LCFLAPIARAADLLTASATPAFETSWSPDGAFIASSNAMNKAVFTAALIERAGYKQDVSFVGHSDTVEVTVRALSCRRLCAHPCRTRADVKLPFVSVQAFNPCILHPASKPSRKHVTCLLALGSDDRSISLWGNKSRKPLVVVKEIFDGRIWDLSWTRDGKTLWACSADGTVVSLAFEEGEVEGFAKEGVLQVRTSSDLLCSAREMLIGTHPF
jgi:protein HIRA/HIR1